MVGSGSNCELYVMVASELFGLLNSFSHCFYLILLFCSRWSLFNNTPLFSLKAEKDPHLFLLEKSEK